MRFRRRPDPELVRITKRNLPNLSGDLAGEVVRLRRTMYQAVNQIDAGASDIARQTLVSALRERWWD